MIKRSADALKDLDDKIEDLEGDDAKKRERADRAGGEARRKLQDPSLGGRAEGLEIMNQDDVVGEMS